MVKAAMASQYLTNVKRQTTVLSIHLVFQSAHQSLSNSRPRLIILVIFQSGFPFRNDPCSFLPPQSSARPVRKPTSSLAAQERSYVLRYLFANISPGMILAKIPAASWDTVLYAEITLSARRRWTRRTSPLVFLSRATTDAQTGEPYIITE